MEERDVAAGDDTGAGASAGTNDLKSLSQFISVLMASNEGTYGNTEALDVLDVNERCAVVVACFDQAAPIDEIRIIVFANGNAAGPIGRIDGLEGRANGTISGVADSGRRALVVSERSE